MNFKISNLLIKKFKSKKNKWKNYIYIVGFRNENVRSKRERRIPQISSFGTSRKEDKLKIFVTGASFVCDFIYIDVLIISFLPLQGGFRAGPTAGLCGNPLDGDGFCSQLLISLSRPHERSRYVTVQYSIVQYSIVLYDIVQYNIEFSRIVQYSIVYGVVQYSIVQSRGE